MNRSPLEKEYLPGSGSLLSWSPLLSWVWPLPDPFNEDQWEKEYLPDPFNSGYPKHHC